MDPSLPSARRDLLFHISAVLYVNECYLEAVDENKMPRSAHYKLLYHSVVRESLELDGTMNDISENLPPIIAVLHKAMMCYNKSKGRQEPCEALKYWKELNESNVSMISPRPFNMVARSCLSSQASSAPAERLFSYLGKMENNQAQSMLCRTLQMTELIRIFVHHELGKLSIP